MSNYKEIPLIERFFTKYDTTDVYDEYFNWKKVDVLIKDYQTDEIIFEGHDLEFPEDYSQQACDIIASKYFYRDIDGLGTPETSLRQVIHRMVRFWVEALIDEGLIYGSYWTDNHGNYNFDYGISDNCFNIFDGDAGILYDELAYTLLNQMWAPNSPQWFNTGIGYYGIKGDPDDMYYCDETGVHKSQDRYTRSQTSACFIIPVTDHLIGKDSITDHFVTETKLFKGGSGVGTNFSPLRAEGERLSSGGKSSGVMSFLLGLDRNAGAIKSGGTTRRAAKMVILDVDHPDIYDFVKWKVREEYKAQNLISLGYEGGMNGEAYQTVSGQNGNNSVRLSKEFMDKVLGIDDDPTWELKGRKDKSVNMTVNALNLWDEICTAAWECADPGVQFDDRYNEWNTVPNAGRINATNPCSEFAFIDNSACNLASINILKFYNTFEDTNYNRDSYRHVINLCQLVLEASIYWGQFPTEDVAKNSYLYRPTGLGLANLGAFFLKCGLAYDSEEACNLAGKLAAVMTAQSYLTSAKMAEQIGYCKGFQDNWLPMIDVLNKHQEHTTLFTLENSLFGKAIELARSYGVRNMQTTVMAPTGTISLAMDCETTGIEPFFSHSYFKKCSDGSVMELTNPLAEEYLTSYDRLDLEPHEFKLIQEYFNEYHTYQGAPYLEEKDQKVLETANEISPKAHINMMAAMQPFISGSISKTVNMPYSATVEDVKEVFEDAYEKGLKSVSIYRDGSKGTQPLNVDIRDPEDDDFVKPDREFNYHKVIVNKGGEFTLDGTIEEDQFVMLSKDNESIFVESNKNLSELNIRNKKDDEYMFVLSGYGDDTASSGTVELERKKPNGIRESTTHNAKIGNVELYITVSYYSNGDLCEIFVSSDKEGTTTKGLLSSLSKSISHMLQYGIDPLKIAAMLRNQRYEPAGVVERHPNIKMCTSISDLIARIIEFECGDCSRIQVKPCDDDFEDEHGEDSQSYLIAVADDDGEVVWKREDGDMTVYTGNECPICHGFRLVQNGSCEVCLDCGNTTGCS